MLIRRSALITAITLASAGATRAGVLSSAFTYQGQLREGGAPVNGEFDMRFTLRYPGAGIVAGPICLDNVDVVNGLFQADLDFGSVYGGNPLELQVELRPGGVLGNCTSGVYQLLNPPQPIAPVPYALHAESAPTPHALDAADGTPANSVYVDTFGNVGVGTTTPASRLHVSGTGGLNGIKVQTNTANYARLSLATQNNDFLLQTEDASGDWFGIYQNTGTIGWRFVVEKDSGNVGIGTTDPTNRLSVVGNGDFSGSLGLGIATPDNKLHVHRGSAGTVTGHSNAPLVVENSSHAYVNLLSPDANERGILFGDPASNVSGGIIYNNAAAPDGLQFRTENNATRLTITSEGDVGIGTASPSRRLEVQNSQGVARINSTATSFGSVLELRNGTAGASTLGIISFVDAANASKGQISFSSANNMSLSTNGLTRMTITSGGDVGIGTNAPTGRLTVSGNADDVILPTGSIDPTETVGEAGGASDARLTTTAVPLPGVEAAVLAARSINCPQDGYVIAFATCTVYVNGDAQASLHVAKTTASAAASPSHTMELNGGFSSDEKTLSFHAVFAVTAGSHSFELLGRSFVNSVDALERRLTLLFVPTAYGTMDVED